MPGFKSLPCRLLLLSAIIAAAMPAAAADFHLRRAPQSAAAPAPAHQPGHVTYIRRLMRDANTAAARGDAAAARRLAERAHKIAVTYQSALTGCPDCTPDATAVLAQKFGSTIGSPAKKSSSEPSAAPPPRALAKSPTQELDILSLVDPKYRAEKTPTARASETATSDKTPTDENRLVSTSTARQQAKPAAQSNKSDAASQQPHPNMQASPAKVSRPVTRATPKASDSSRPESPSDQRQRTVSRSIDAERSLQTVANRPAKSPRSSAQPERQPISDPEVQSAIGSANDWEVELNTDADSEDVPTRSPEAQLPPAPPAEEISRTRSARSSADPTIGVWYRGNETRSVGATPKHAVSLPDFLSPDISPASRNVDAASRDRGTQLIETDFRRPVHSQAPQLLLRESASSRPAALSGPTIRVREEPAVHWPDAARSAASKLSKAEPLPLGPALPKSASERLALVIGIALLVGGCVLFGLSFRRA